MPQNSDLVYAAVQNGVILDVFSDIDSARARCQEEIKRDFISIIFRRKLRKLFKKTGDVALHRYSVITIVSSEDIK